MINFRNWDDPTSQSRNNIVFADRNHNYGAYVIRTNYNSSVLNSFFSTLTFFTLLFTAPYIYSRFKTEVPVVKYKEVIYEFKDFTEPKKTEEIKKPEEKIIKKPSLGSNKSYTNVMVKDTAENDSVPTQDLLALVNTSGSGKGKDTVETVLPFDDGRNGTSADTKIHTYAEVMPQFPGGQDALVRFLSANIKYPSDARENNIQGTVYMSFVIDKKGKVTSMELKRGIGYGCDEEAMRVLNKMPDWEPGKMDQHPVNVQFAIPISFRLQ